MIILFIELHLRKLNIVIILGGWIGNNYQFHCIDIWSIEDHFCFQEWKVGKNWQLMFVTLKRLGAIKLNWGSIFSIDKSWLSNYVEIIDQSVSLYLSNSPYLSIKYRYYMYVFSVLWCSVVWFAKFDI